MARRRTLSLSPEQQHELTTLRNHTKDEYVRERCAALLKIASGRSPHWVARHGLLKPRDPDTLYSWLGLYEAQGATGLHDHRHGGQRRGAL
jgi:hypothetical protein